MESLRLQNIHVLFCVNNDYVPYLGFCLSSIMDAHENKDVFFNFHVFHQDISSENKNKIIGLFKEDKCSTIFYNIKNKHSYSKIPRLSHITIETTFRLLAHTELIHIDKILYLDADTLVMKDFLDIWEKNIDKYLSGVIFDPRISGTSHLTNFGFSKNDPYFNAGVLLLNLKAMRERKIEEKYNYIVKNSLPNLKYADQDILNLALQGQCVWLDPSYNLVTEYFINPSSFKILKKFLPNFKLKKSLSQTISNPKIVHFTGINKPWHISFPGPQRELYLKYLKISWAPNISSIHFLFTITQKDIFGLAVSILSILQSKQKDNNVFFHIIHSPLSDNAKEKIELLKGNRSLSIRYYPERFVRSIDNETYYKFFAHEYIHDTKKVIHLDVNTIVMKDLEDVWNLPLGGDIATGVRDPLKEDSFLSGSNLLHLDLMRKRGTTRKVLDMIYKNKCSLKYKNHETLNKVFNKKMMEIPPWYNVTGNVLICGQGFRKTLQFPSRNIDDLNLVTSHNNPYVISFSEKDRLWHCVYSHPLKKHYAHLAKKIPWTNQSLDTPLPFCKKIFYRALFTFLKGTHLKNVIKRKIKNRIKKNTKFYRIYFNLYCWIFKKGHRKLIEELIKRNEKICPKGLKKGLTLFTYFNKQTPSFFYLEKMIECKIKRSIAGVDGTLIWGTAITPDKHKVLKKTLEHGLPLFIAEDAFIRSIDVAVNNAAALSCIVDHTGVFYSANMGSIIKKLLDSEWVITAQEKNTSRKAIDFIVANCISKYNLINHKELNFNKDRKYDSVVLALDQRRGDQSVSNSDSNASTFKRMLSDAIRENDNSLILVKIHPEAFVGKSSGYFVHLANKDLEERIMVLDKKVNPISLLKSVDKVYTVSSQMGLEALMCGKTVFSYGWSFYAGRGVTIDRQLKRKKMKPRGLEEIFYASYIKYTHYFNPEVSKPCDIFEVMNYLIKEREKI